MKNTPQLFTAPTRWDLVCKASEELHACMRRSRRNRWWFLPRAGSQAEQTFQQWRLFQGEGGGLGCVIRADCYEPTGSPVISVEFWVVPQRQGDKPPQATRRKSLVVRVGLVGEGKQGSTMGKIADTYAAFGQGARDYAVFDPITKGRRVPSSRAQALRHMRKARSQPLARILDQHPSLNKWADVINPPEQQWWVHPQKTPLAYTRFVLLVCLAREDYIDENSPAIRSFLRSRVFGRWMMGRETQALD